MNEIWRDAIDYEGIYQISNLGRVRTIKNKILAIGHYPNGYCYANFTSNGKRTTQLIHRLVAKAFIPNTENKPEVNHKDEDITNNKIDNLEWMTSKENANYGTRNERCALPQRIKVVQLTLNNMFVKLYDSCTEASQFMNVGRECISRTCKGKQKKCNGYKFMYYEDYLIAGI